MIRVRSLMNTEYNKYIPKEWIGSELFLLTNQSSANESCSSWLKSQTFSLTESKYGYEDTIHENTDILRCHEIYLALHACYNKIIWFIHLRISYKLNYRMPDFKTLLFYISQVIATLHLALKLGGRWMLILDFSPCASCAIHRSCRFVKFIIRRSTYVTKQELPGEYTVYC